MKRHAHMVDLLRPELNFEDELFTLTVKQELTEEDYQMIIDKSVVVIKAAIEARKQRYGK